jgi:hypothetical protein
VTIVLGLLATFGVELAAGSALGTALGVLSSPWAKGAFTVLRLIAKAGSRPLTEHEKKQVQTYRASRTPSDMMGRW